MLDLNRLNSSISCSNSDGFTTARVIIGFVGTVKWQNTAEMNNQTSMVNAYRVRRNVGSLIAGDFGKTKQKYQNVDQMNH